MGLVSVTFSPISFIECDDGASSGNRTIDGRGASSTISATEGREAGHARAAERGCRRYWKRYGSFEEASAYRCAADKLLQVMQSPGNSLPLRDPTYFLYHHAIELILKACLLSHGLHKTGHNIRVLSEFCRTNRFLSLDDVHFGIALLESGNIWNRYRYAVEKNTLMYTALSSVHKVVGRLFEAVEPQVIAWATNNSDVPAPSTIWRYLLLDEAVTVKQPVPSKPGP